MTNDYQQPLFFGIDLASPDQDETVIYRFGDAYHVVPAPGDTFATWMRSTWDKTYRSATATFPLPGAEPDREAQAERIDKINRKIAAGMNAAMDRQVKRLFEWDGIIDAEWRDVTPEPKAIGPGNDR